MEGGTINRHRPCSTLILITHNDVDHFDPNVLGRYLEACPQAVVVTTDEVVRDMQSGFAHLDQIKDRLRALVPSKKERIQFTLSGIGLEVLNLPHGITPTNVGFIIHLAGKKLLHTGDTANPAIPAVYNLAAEGLDLAFVHLYYLTDKQYLKADGPAAIVDVVGAEWIVPMHCQLEELPSGNAHQEFRERYPQSMLFRERMVPQVLP